jgi:hypothetical protein
MKIYINNFNLYILPDVLELLNEKIVKTKTNIQVYSIDGIYSVEEKTTKKLNYFDNNITILKNYYNNITLIVDPSYYTTELVNYINPEHISRKIIRYFFEIEKNSKLKLVIEGEIVEDINQNEHDINLCDMYFELPNNIDINDAFVKKEIIVFLSLLN